jgi:beta-phosphoglucomutase-like phosphatase (HAD superfamily)
MNKIILNKKEAIKLFNQLGDNFIVVKNPDYIFSPFDLYPAAPALKELENLKAVVMDMDGTTTTTESICIHSLELMVRRMSNRIKKNDWSGLTNLDYPHIIGNSTTKHVEYLINRYKKYLSVNSIIYWFIYSALWTIKNSKDVKRIDEVKNDLSILGFESFEKKEETQKYINGKLSINKATELLSRFYINITIKSKNQLIRAGIDIYYQRYHEILGLISQGKSKLISKELFGNPNKNLIEAMPGVLIFISFIKGWLDKQDIEAIRKYFAPIKSDCRINQKNFLILAEKFRKQRVKIGLVTSSIFYEADLVIKEVFKVLQSQIKSSILSESKKEFLLKKFSDYHNIYDCFVTASDSSEVRLKPHRDLYSIALHQLNINKEDFDKVLGLEDSESGTIAIRTAGIGMAVAVPFAETRGHNLLAASHICYKGLPELILKHSLFIKI